MEALSLPQEAKELFAQPLSSFTSARDALCRRLASEGRPSEAAAVKRLRKPSVTAWAMNQVAHRSPKKVAWLLRSADRLREARSKAELREASSARTELVSGFVEEAIQVLASAGHAAGPTAAQRMAQTLLAAIADPRLGVQLAEGMLLSDASAGEPDLSWGSAIPAAAPRRSERDALAEEVARLDADRRSEAERAARLQNRADEAADAANRAAADAARVQRLYEEAVARLEGLTQ